PALHWELAVHPVVRHGLLVQTTSPSVSTIQNPSMQGPHPVPGVHGSVVEVVAEQRQSPVTVEPPPQLHVPALQFSIIWPMHWCPPKSLPGLMASSPQALWPQGGGAASAMGSTEP